MSEALHHRLTRLQWLSLTVGLLGVGLCALGYFVQRQQFFFSWLFAWLFWAGLSIGCFLVFMIHQLTGGRWGYPTRRFFEAGLLGLPLMLVLFVPVYFGLAELYPWARSGDVASELALRHRGDFDKPWAYIARTLGVLIIFTVLATYLRRCSLAQDRTPDAAPTRRARVLSGIGVVAVGLLATIAAVDWIMSLEKRWFSTVFAVVMMGGQVMVAFAFSILMLTWFRHDEPLSGVINKTHYHHLGNLLLTFVMFWTYVSFGQLLIIYSGDLPPELDWYLHRIAGSWKWVISGLAAFHFFVPFFLLLFRVVKRHVMPLTAIASLLFVAHLVDAYWLVMPSLHDTGMQVSWLDFAAPVGIGGLWFSFFLSRLKAAHLIPQHDPGLQFAFVYGT